MASPDDQLPEGTDAIIEGAGVDDDSDSADRSFTATGPSGTGQADTGTRSNSDTHGASAFDGTPLFGRFDDLRGQATDKARDFAQAGKDRATAALDNLVQTVEDAAAEIDDKLGRQYGDYARRAAQSIGSFSDNFRDKDVDDLFADARALIARSPAIAVGTAAALGFVVARLARSGLADGGAHEGTPKA